MRLARIADSSTESYILVKGNEAITRQEITSQLGISLPDTLERLLERDFAENIERLEPKLQFKHKLNKFQFLCPITNPPKIIFLNFNYKDQSGWIRFGKTTPREPVFYLKPRTCLNGPFDDIICPDFVSQLDFEGELAVVIGKKCKNISEADAPFAISGYMVMNDVSARDIQYTDVQVSRSKCFDTFAPCGPWITRRGELKDPNDLRVITKVNGEVRQDSRTSNMVLRIEEIISKLSKVMTLEPDDIISTGTPMGTILSSHGSKPWLRNGDIIEVEVEGLGSIRNKVRFESHPDAV